MSALRVGDARIDSVLETEVPYRFPAEMFPGADDTLVDAHRAWMEPRYLDPDSGKMVFAFRSFVVRIKGLTILVDTCVGNEKNRPHRANWHKQNWPWLTNLRACGVTPEEIDLVMCTHLHVDHIGWNTKLRDGRWVPTFPNAKYLFHKTEYAFWEKEYPKQAWIEDAFVDSVLPVVDAGQAVMVDSGHEIADGIWIEPSPGHTPGHSSLCLERAGGSAVFCGDMMHHPLQIPEPQLASIFCTDAAQSTATRRDFIDRHCDTDTVVLPAHFPGAGTGGGHIVGRMHGDKAGFRPVGH